METGFDILGTPRPELAAWLERIGVGAVHADDVFAAFQRPGIRGHLLDRLGPKKRNRLFDEAQVAPVTLVSAHDTAFDAAGGDGAEKLLFELDDGRRVEGVLLPQKSGRVSFCVSSQAGCAMGCAFCSTARLGLERHLRAGEITGQIILAAERCRERGQRLSAVVFMGMGEPLHNYEAVHQALVVLQDHYGLMLPGRRLTVSTVGLVKGIDRLAADFGGSVSLAVSLVAGTQETREQIIPTARRYPLDLLHAACERYPRPGSRRYLLLEYALLPGVNDTDAELAGVADFCRGLDAVVNLIPFNPFPGAPFQSPTSSDIDRAWKRLDAHGVRVTVRRPRGREMHAACGQLARQSA